jgi:N6-L-threonylcarbamoyladenine synthase
MKILSIDTSCDESCAAVFDTDKWRLLSDVVQSHVPTMAEYGGIVPELASRAHLTALPQVIAQALQQAGLEPSQLDHIAISNRPGLIGALLVGLNFGKAFAWALDIPFSAEDHIEGHLYSPLLSETSENPPPKSVPPFPWISLVVSGGHTELFYVPELFNHQWLGGTLDDAAGEAFDKIGKILGLGYPAGPVIDRLARELSMQSEAKLPVRFPVANVEPFHFSYSGLKTAVNLHVSSTRRQNGDLTKETQAALARAAQEAILLPLSKEVHRALERHPQAVAVVAGGVACNTRLRELLPDAYFPLPKHCTDNAAMIALVAALKHRIGKLQPASWDTTASPRSDWPSLGAPQT